MIAYRSGDNQALQTLMNCFDRLMSSAARRYLHCQQDVEDAVQDAWISFMRAADGIDTPSAIAGWLSTTTARAALAIARRQSRCVPSDFALEAGPPAIDPDRVVLEEEITAVREAVTRLEGFDRELIRMLFEAEQSYAEIGARTGRPEGSIGPTRQRVMTKLRSDRSIRRLTLDCTR